MKIENVEKTVEEVEYIKKIENKQDENYCSNQENNNFLNKLINTRYWILFIGILLLIKTIFFYKCAIFVNINEKMNNIESMLYTSISLMVLSSIFLAVILSIPMLLKNRARFWVTLVIDFVISALLFADEVYYSYSSNLISVSQISNLQYGREISAALPNLLHIRQFIYFIDILIFIILIFTKKIKINKLVKTKIWPGIVCIVLTIVEIIAVGKTCIPKAREYQYNKIQQITTSSIYGYHYIDISNSINMKKNLKYKSTESMLKEYDNLKNAYNKNYALQYDFRDIAKDKNVIVVQLESVQNFVVNRKINGYEITPNLNKFLNENIEFTNMHNQSYSSTADSEFGVMNSVYPLENGMCFAQYPSNNYSSIYEMFKKNDYSTTYIHGNVGSFWNREAVYSRLKLDNLIFDNVFNEDVERINQYVSDEEVYKKIVDEMKTYDDKFFVNIVAASSHIPFELQGLQDREHKVNIDVGDEYRGMFFGNYLESMNYADYAFGVFIKELKKAGLYDDTVILVYGDHAGLQMYNYEMMDFINEVSELNDIKTQINYSNVLCGLKIPGVDSMKITKPVSKLDVKPTLTEICGIKDEFSLGESMFSNKDFIGLNNGKIITDKYFYDGSWYRISDGESIDLDNVSEDLKRKLNYYSDCLQKELDISLSINILNLLK